MEPHEVILDPHVLNAILCLVLAWFGLIILWAMIMADSEKGGKR